MGADKKSAVSDLMEQGKLKGKLTTKEITDALEELDFDVEQMDKLYDSLESLNIEIIEDYNPEQDLDLNLNLDEKTATHGVTIPFHPGAASYYKDKGITVNTK